jgi:hypothetical protein
MFFTDGYSTFAASHIKTAAGNADGESARTSQTAYHRVRIPRVAGDPWPYFTRPCARQRRRLNFLHRSAPRGVISPRLNVCNIKKTGGRRNLKNAPAILSRYKSARAGMREMTPEASRTFVFDSAADLTQKFSLKRAAGEGLS